MIPPRLIPNFGAESGRETPKPSAHLDAVRQLSLSLVYWLQTERPRHDGGQGFPGLYLRPDISGTADGLAKEPYIRESLRLKAMYMMREQDGRNRDGETKDRARPRFAHVMYPDGIFAWQFHWPFVEPA